MTVKQMVLILAIVRDHSPLIPQSSVKKRSTTKKNFFPYLFFKYINNKFTLFTNPVHTCSSWWAGTNTIDAHCSTHTLNLAAASFSYLNLFQTDPINQNFVFSTI